jgi:hypothetical protein
MSPAAAGVGWPPLTTTFGSRTTVVDPQPASTTTATRAISARARPIFERQL